MLQWFVKTNGFSTRLHTIHISIQTITPTVVCQLSVLMDTYRHVHSFYCGATQICSAFQWLWWLTDYIHFLMYAMWFCARATTRTVFSSFTFIIGYLLYLHRLGCVTTLSCPLPGLVSAPEIHFPYLYYMNRSDFHVQAVTPTVFYIKIQVLVDTYGGDELS